MVGKCCASGSRASALLSLVIVPAHWPLSHAAEEEEVHLPRRVRELDREQGVVQAAWRGTAVPGAQRVRQGCSERRAG